jgi:hypothetical protein
VIDRRPHERDSSRYRYDCVILNEDGEACIAIVGAALVNSPLIEATSLAVSPLTGNILHSADLA